MSKSASSELAENKLLILYLIYKMDVPLKNSYISQFALEGGFMDYFSLQQYLTDMEESGLLEKSKNNNNTLYTLTEHGDEVLNFFIKHIPDHLKNDVSRYISKNKRKIKKDFEVVAHYFYNSDNDYIVKCGAYENELTLMELNISVVSKEEAKLICSNWKSNSHKLYGSIINTLLYPEKEAAPDNSTQKESAN